DGMGREIAGSVELTVIGRGKRFIFEHLVFDAGPASGPDNLFGHGGGITLGESKLVEVETQGWRIEPLRLSFVGRGVGLGKLVQIEVGANDIGIAFAAAGIEAQRVLTSG